MSEFRIEKITNKSGSAGANISGITTFSGTSGMQLPSGPIEYRGGRGRGVFYGRFAPSPNQETIDYIEIATTGNSKVFVDLSVAMSAISGCSNGHGGL